MSTFIKRFTLLGIVCFCFWNGNLYAKSATSDGHVLNDFEVTKQGEDYLLKLAGSFIPSLFSKIEIVSGEDNIIHHITIPQSLANTQSLKPGTLLKFQGIFNQIVLEEKLASQGKQTLFKTQLVLTTRIPAMIRLRSTMSSKEQLVFAVSKKPFNVPQGTEDDLVVAEDIAPEEDEKQPEVPINAAVAKVEMPKESAHTVIDPSKNLLLHPVSALLVYERPTLLQVSIFNASLKQKSAEQLSFLLGRHQRRNIEDRVGMKLEITNISSVREATTLEKTKIYFRPNYLAAALALSETIPGEQTLEPMPLERKGKLGIDIEIYVGTNFE